MSNKTAGIVGFGAMGSFVAETLRRHKYDVGVFDTDSDRLAQAKSSGYASLRIEEAAKRDIVVSAVPMPQQYETVKTLGRLMKGGSMLTSVNSRQRAVTQAALETVQDGVEVTQIHPIFRPTISWEGQKVAISPITPHGGGLWTKEMIKMLHDENAVMVMANPDEHDQAMDIIQGLTHTEGMIFLETLRRIGADLSSIMKFSSPVYATQIGLAARIAGGKPDLYGPLQLYSEKLPEILSTLSGVLQDHAAIVKSGEMPRFDAMYRTLQDYLGSFGAAATEATDRKLGVPRGIHIYFVEGEEPEIEAALLKKLGSSQYKEWLRIARVNTGELGVLEKYPLARHTLMKPKTAKSEGAAVFFVKNRTHPGRPEMENGMLFTGIIQGVEKEQATTGTGKFYRVPMNGSYSDPFLNLFDTYTRKGLRPLGPLIAYQVV